MHCYNITRTTNYHTHSCVNNNYECIRRRLCNAHFFTCYAGIMLNAFLYLLWSKLFSHIWRMPTQSIFCRVYSSITVATLVTKERGGYSIYTDLHELMDTFSTYVCMAQNQWLNGNSQCILYC